MLKKFTNYFYYILLFTSFHKQIFSDELQMPDNFANQDSIPSAIVNGVNVITGDFCEFNQDIMIPGIAQHHFDRSYVSSNVSYGNICCAWSSNFGGILSLSRVDHLKPRTDVSFYITYKGPYASYSSFERSFYKKSIPECFPIEIDKNTYTKGLTNTGKGQICAATHPKNNRFYYNKNNSQLALLHSNGEESVFRYDSRKELYRITELKKLNKHTLKYSFLPNALMSKVAVHNSENEEISKFEIHYDFRNDPHVQIYGDGGHSVRYNLIGYQGGMDNIYWYIKDVKNSRCPDVSYSLEPFTHPTFNTCMRVNKKIMPKGNVLSICYFQEEKLFGIKKGDPIINKVSGIGFRNKKNEKIFDKSINSFYYRTEGPGKGSTNVYSPKRDPITYHYDKYRLTKIVQTLSTKKYLIQKFHWSDWKNYEGNLDKKAMYNGNEDLLESTSYFYDTKGNILEEQYLGDLTGNSTFLNPNECYIKRNTYYSDKRNLIQSTDDGKKRINYIYYDDTNLIKYKYVTADGIKLRNYFEYDKNGAVTLEIIDDGCNEDINDITNVSERHIKEIINTTQFPIGLPKIVYTKYFDIKTSQIVNINKKELTYTCEGWLEKEEVFDPNNQLISSKRFIYNSHGKVIEEYDSLGQGTFKYYDEAENLIKLQGPRTDFHILYTYDQFNRLIAEEIVQDNGIRLKKTFVYDEGDNKISESDIFGNVTHYVYDELSRLIEAKFPSGEVKKYEYNCRNQIIAEIDHYNNVTKFDYTSRNQLSDTYYPDGRIEKSRYDLAGSLCFTYDRDGTVTEHTKDYLDRTIKKTIKSESGEHLFDIIYEYNAFHLLKEIDAAGNQTLYEYDGIGREIKVTKGDHVKETAYDVSNRISEVRTYSLQEAGEIITKYEYDRLNRVIHEQRLDENGEIQHEEYFAYDSVGNIIEVISNGHAGSSSIKKQYDALGNIILITDPEGNETRTSFRYDYMNEDSNFVHYEETTDPKGNITIKIKNLSGQDACILLKDSFENILHKTTYTYNHTRYLSQKNEEVYKEGKTDRTIIKQWFYNSNGEIVAIKDAVGSSLQKEIYFAYNSYGQKTCVKKSDGTYLNYFYGPRGILKEMSSSDNTIHYQYEYDQLDNLVKMTDVLTGATTERKFDLHKQLIYEKLANDLEISFSYHINGKKKNIILPDKSSIENHFKGNNLHKIVRLNKDGEWQYEHLYEDYDHKGCYKNVQLVGNAGRINYSYDILTRVIRTESKHWSEIIAGFDESGNMKERKIITSRGESEEEYTYDSLYQLTSERNHTYQYDSLHNRISKDSKVHIINDLNQVTHDGDKSYTYDSCGNLKEILSDNPIAFNYDALDRLCFVEKEKEQFHYIYDAKNRRIAKEKYERNLEGKWILCTVERYLYEDQHEIGSFDPFGNINSLRILGQGRGAEIGAAIAIEIDNETYVPIHDYQGNVVVVLSAEDGSIEESSTYSAFGEENIYDANFCEKSTSIQPWHFSSKRTDEETGFTYFGYRYYSRELGKWITSDPLGDRDGPNLYAYVKNRPYFSFDHFGLFGIDFDDGEIPYPYYHPDSISNINYMAGSCLEWTAINYYEPGIERYCLEGIGKMYQGESFWSHSQRGSVIAEVGEGYIGPGIRQLTITGIWSNIENTLEFARSISLSSGGTKVTAICNQTNGRATDLLHAGGSYLGNQTPSSEYLSFEICRMIIAALAESNSPKIFIHIHSRGTMEFKVAMENIPEEYRKYLYVYAYGGEVLKDKGYGELKNIMNPGDPLIALNPAHWGDSSEITWTKEPMKWDIISNHFIMGSGYQNAMKKYVNEYYDKYRQ